MMPLLVNARKRAIFLVGVVLLLLSVFTLPVLKIVRVKMLPFDNKSEFQVIVDMPEGTTLEQTTRVAREVARRVAQEPEVVNYQIYAGTAEPLQLQWPGAPLLSAAGRQRGGHSGEPAPQGRALRAKP